jgi:phenylacetate-CoA ligase
VIGAIRRLAWLELHRAAGIPLRAVRRDIAHERARSNAGDLTRARLARLLDHARAHVPFYRDLLPRRGPDEDPFKILAALPLLTPGMLRSEFDSLCSDDLDTRRWYDTGSARSPVHLVQDAGHRAHAIATLEIFHASLGRRIGERAEVIWGDERNPDGGRSGVIKRICRVLANEHWTESFRLTEEQMLALLDRLARHPPKLVVAYAPAIYELARFAERNAIPVRPQRAIVTVPGALDDVMRAAIERVFKCEAFNEYWSSAVGPVAQECEAHAGLHVAPWANYLEVVDAGGWALPAGEEGQIVITCLTNYAMPLIRYAIGDAGSLAPAGTCICGRDCQRLATLRAHRTGPFQPVEPARTALYSTWFRGPP